MKSFASPGKTNQGTAEHTLHTQHSPAEDYRHAGNAKGQDVRHTHTHDVNTNLIKKYAETTENCLSWLLHEQRLPIATECEVNRCLLVAAHTSAICGEEQLAMFVNI